MNFIWAAEQLQGCRPVRRQSWKLGEYVGNDRGLFWCAAHEETYNIPSVSIDYNGTIEDYLADDWESVTIYPACKWHVYRSDINAYNRYFNLQKDAIAYSNQFSFGEWKVEKVSYHEKEIDR
jgi:hypothetical protein